MRYLESVKARLDCGSKAKSDLQDILDHFIVSAGLLSRVSSVPGHSNDSHDRMVMAY